MGWKAEGLVKLMVAYSVDQLGDRAFVMEVETAAVRMKRASVHSKVDYVAGAFEILQGQ